MLYKCTNVLNFITWQVDIIVSFFIPYEEIVENKQTNKKKSEDLPQFSKSKASIINLMLKMSPNLF